MKFAVIGAVGTIGRATVTALLDRGHSVRVVGRSEQKLKEAFERMTHTHKVTLGVSDVTTLEGCRKAVVNTDGYVYSLGLPYTKKDFAQYPQMMKHMMAATAAEDITRGILISNVYPYGKPTTDKVDESHPRNPIAVKGQHRKEQEDIFLGAHGVKGFKAISLRLPDFYGPFAEQSLAHLIFDAAINDKTADVFAPIDTPHEFVYTPDVGPIVADLMGKDAAFGEAYNFAGFETITVRDFATRIFRTQQREPKLRATGGLMLRMIGLFSPLVREFIEMEYLQKTPIILDDQKLKAVLPEMKKTSYDEGIAATFRHMKTLSPTTAG